MNYHIEISVTAEKELHIVYADGGEQTKSQSVKIPLSELYAEGNESANQRIGEHLLERLKENCPSAFEGESLGEPALSGPPTTMDLVMQLIHHSVASTTAVHVGSIDSLLQSESTKSEEAQRFLNSTWPPIKARLISFGTNG